MPVNAFALYGSFCAPLLFRSKAMPAPQVVKPLPVVCAARVLPFGPPPGMRSGRNGVPAVGSWTPPMLASLYVYQAPMRPPCIRMDPSPSSRLSIILGLPPPPEELEALALLLDELALLLDELALLLDRAQLALLLDEDELALLLELLPPAPLLDELALLELLPPAPLDELALLELLPPAPLDELALLELLDELALLLDELDGAALPIPPAPPPPPVPL